MIPQKIGILGGGQLGLMLLQAAIDWHLDIHILDPDADAPCRSIAPHFKQGSLQDYDTVYNFGKDLDIITIEIEKVNVDALAALVEEGKRVYPQPSVIRKIQDKRIQKQFYKENDLPTAEFRLTKTRADVAKHADFLPAFHKLGKDGYDGRGVQRIDSIEDLDKAFDAPGLLEKAVDFEKEIAVIVARNPAGIIKTFPVVEMAFHPEHNLVDYLFALFYFFSASRARKYPTRSKISLSESGSKSPVGIIETGVTSRDCTSDLLRITASCPTTRRVSWRSVSLTTLPTKVRPSRVVTTTIL